MVEIIQRAGRHSYTPAQVKVMPGKSEDTSLKGVSTAAAIHDCVWKLCEILAQDLIHLATGRDHNGRCVETQVQACLPKLRMDRHAHQVVHL